MTRQLHLVRMCLAAALFAVCLALASTISALSPSQSSTGASTKTEPATSTALSRSAVLTILQTGTVAASDLVDLVRARGLSFEMTREDDSPFRAAGASEELLEALWRYDAFSIPAGEPLAESQVTTLLQNGVPAPRVTRFVEARKVRFKADEALAKALRGQGGSDALILAIGRSFSDAKSKPEPDPNLAIIRFYNRDRLRPSIFVDGVELARLPSGQGFTHRVEPGEHRFQAGGLKGEILHLTVSRGAEYYLKVKRGMINKLGVSLVVVSPVTAREEFATAKPLEEKWLLVPQTTP